jgi:outer membrane protein OmpA-like peptidoglycan-associated protein
MNRTLVALVAGACLTFSLGCSTKNYVRKEVSPVIDKTNELDELTARNSRDIREVDSRAQQGIQSVNTKASEADQKALAAGRQADEAASVASRAVTGVNALTQAVANLDNYRPVTEVAVHFGFDQADLTRKAKQALDELAKDVPNTRQYIVEIVGGADSTGDKDYNYALSQRRASAVIQYLAQKHNLPAHKVYLIGLGEDKPVASNISVAGRRKNRRVDVRLMTSVVGGSTAAQNTQQQPQ